MAVGGDTFNDAGGAVQSLFQGFGAEAQGQLQAEGLNIKAQGDLAEATEYDEAGALAKQNEAFTAQSTAIKPAQSNRQVTQAIGGEEASVAGAGFANSGSSMAMLRDSASQGALTTAVAGEQGLITEASYNEQAQSYQTMSTAATTAAGEEQQLATDTKNAADTAATGDFASGLIKGVGALASIALAPVTGGASLAVGVAAAAATSGTGGLY